MSTGFKIFSDPVHGFISVPKELILDLVQTPEVQRLRRIRQLGVGHLVFPGAEHTRFVHALGAMALMQDALQNLSEKGTPISSEENLAAMAAALLHDLGHGPFSHTLEHELITDFHHEAMSRKLLVRLNDRFGGVLGLTLEIFDDNYERPFFHQLISSQLDMDRLDYLRRDSFYTGVSEGVVGVDRIIKTMRVHPLPGGSDSEIIIEAKGVYAIENFLISRRLMYWQVYLHKTVVAGDHLLRSIIRRVRAHLDGTLTQETPTDLSEASEALFYFLERKLTADDLDNPELCDQYASLDDIDVLYSLKQWATSSDSVLADLSQRFINREFFRVRFLPNQPTPEQIRGWREEVADWLLARQIAGTPSEAEEALPYYLMTGTSRHAAYTDLHESIRILGRNQQIRELSRTSEALSVGTLTSAVEKPYVCYPKGAELFEQDSD
jgi:HD superfamily phosphohydrolase